MTTTPDYPRPHQGVAGTLRDQDDLLSLEFEAMPRREMMANLARTLWDATLVGNPAPVVARMYERISYPRPGDLVLETTHRGGFYYKAFGILLAERIEFAQSDEEFQKDLEEDLNGESTGWRSTDHAWYVQFGPQPEDICRWENASFIMIPTETHFGSKAIGTPDAGGVTFARDDIVAGLADVGINIE